MKLLLFNLRMDRDDPPIAFAVDWVNALSEHAEEVVVLTMSVGRHNVRENVRVFSVGKEEGKSEVCRAKRFMHILWTLLQRERFDACFAHMMPVFAILGWPLLRLWKIPITLWYVHNTWNPRVWLAEKLVDRVVSTTQGSFPIASDKVIYTGHGIDTRRFSPASGKNEVNSGPIRPFIIVSVSRIAPIKRLETIVEGVILAMRKIGSDGICLRVYGKPAVHNDFAYMDLLQRRVAEAGLTDRITFEGSVSFLEIQDVYRSADLFINLSPNGLDKAALEAMSCAVPTLVSHEPFRVVLGSLTESCFVEKPTPEQLADGILAMWRRTPDERYALGVSLRSLVERDHSLQRLAERLVYKILPCRTS